jgi:hypothetical protein
MGHYCFIHSPLDKCAIPFLHSSLFLAIYKYFKCILLNTNEVLPRNRTIFTWQNLLIFSNLSVPIFIEVPWNNSLFSCSLWLFFQVLIIKSIKIQSFF